MNVASSDLQASLTVGFGMRSAGAIAYRRGWLLDDPNAAPDVTVGWTQIPIGDRTVSVHPSLAWMQLRLGGVTLVLLGYPIDLRIGSREPRVIAAALSKRLKDRSFSRDALEYIAYLGGRYICLVHEEATGAHLVIPDAVGSMPAFWGSARDGRAVVASHSKLVAERIASEPSERARNFMKSARALNTRGTIFLPGVHTHWTDVRPLIPNHQLLVAAGAVRHERFYPFGSTRPAPTAGNAQEMFTEQFERHAFQIVTMGTIGISLTAGRDSQATLAATLPYLDAGSLTWTFHTPHAPHEGMDEDLRGAQALAGRFGLRHLSVPIADTADAEFAAGFAQTMGHGIQFRRLAESYNDHLPSDIIELNSMVAETGTGFYRNRVGAPTVERLAELYSRSEYGRQPEVLAALDEFIDYADFREENFAGIDFHDLFYWEHRIGRWGSQRMQELDVAHMLMLPFNSRGIIEALMAPDIELRREKQALTTYIASNLPVTGH